jgi:DEAD/DEAH box helicase domain-containing protein
MVRFFNRLAAPPPSRPAAKHFMSDINEYIESLKKSSEMGSQVAFHRVISGERGRFGGPERPFGMVLEKMLAFQGIESLYLHQVAAIDAVRHGRHVVVATPTASGKSLVYNLPMMESILSGDGGRGLYIFPLKALAQDQFRIFGRFAGACPGQPPKAAIYDGDTTAWFRKKIRNAPPDVLMTNPEMIHLSLLPYHTQWSDFFRQLRMVVVDEVHTYRGVMGSSMALVFRRLMRICDYYGAKPTFVFCSATVGNPTGLAKQLTGLSAMAVTRSGAPRGRRHLVLMDPPAGPARSAIGLLKAALSRGLRTIVYTQSRKLTELIALWAANSADRYSDRISAYRAGFLPEERREIERKLASGELLAVISTSALELGIDIGDLDLCILVGYPGTVVSTWQRSGRVGRSGQDAAMVLIAGEDALDRYFLNNPERLLSHPPEAAVVNPENPELLSRHLPCAAAELPLSAGEPFLAPEPVQRVARSLEGEGALLRSADGRVLYSKFKSPHRYVDLRGTGRSYGIVSGESGEKIGEIDGFRAFRETHPGAVYLHRGETWRVDALDTETATVTATPARVSYYTRPMGNKQTEIMEILEERRVLGTMAAFGRLKVTDQVTGFERIQVRGNKLLGRTPLDLPPQVFETEGLWFSVPAPVQAVVEAQHLHFMGGIHAVEHGAIGIFPLLVMADRNDLGGISTPFHPQVGAAAIFIYDGIPGGAGLCREAFKRIPDLMAHTLQAIRDCSCDTGCPACVHSPKCGSGNRPIDKAAAVLILEEIGDGTHDPVTTSPEPPATKTPRFISRAGRKPFAGRWRGAGAASAVSTLNYGVFDLETQLSAQEVGGWHWADRMRISCAVLYDSAEDRFFEYTEDRVADLVAHLQRLDLVVGFNVKRFDYRVLSGYVDTDFSEFSTLDLLEDIHRQLGFRLSLDHLARVTLGIRKSADGLQALRWWKEGRIREIIDYCRKDVEITREIYEFGKKNGYLLFRNKAGAEVRINVGWGGGEC